MQITVLSHDRTGSGEHAGITKEFMKRASLAAAFAASLFSGSLSAAMAGDACSEEACAAEERLLGNADEAARFEAYQPFTREIAADGVIIDSLDASLAQAGVAAATMRVRDWRTSSSWRLRSAMSVPLIR